MAVKVKTGGVVPVSGQYRPAGSKTEVTFVEGNRVPPVPTGATTFTLVDKTKVADDVSRSTYQGTKRDIWHRHCQAPCSGQSV